MKNFNRENNELLLGDRVISHCGDRSNGKHGVVFRYYEDDEVIVKFDDFSGWDSERLISGMEYPKLEGYWFVLKKELSLDLPIGDSEEEL